MALMVMVLVVGVAADIVQSKGAQARTMSLRLVMKSKTSGEPPEVRAATRDQ